MAPFGTIYTYPNNPRVIKVQAVGNINGLEIVSAPDFAMGKTNKTPEFLAKFPMGKVPCFEGADGTTLWESDAIAQYVAESGPNATQLLGATPVQRATIRQWIDFADHEILGPLIPPIVWRWGLVPYDEKTEVSSLQKLERSMTLLESYLQGRTYVATEDKLSLADISLAAAFYSGFGYIIDAELRQKYPTVVAWYKNITEIDGLKQAFAAKAFIEKRKAPEN